MTKHLINVRVIGRVWVEAESPEHAEAKLSHELLHLDWNDHSTCIDKNQGESFYDVIDMGMPKNFHLRKSPA